MLGGSPLADSGGMMRLPVGPVAGPRLGGSPVSGPTGYPWADGDILYAADLNSAFANGATISGGPFLPLSGGTVSGPVTLAANSALTLQNGTGYVVSPQYFAPGNTITGASSALAPRLSIGMNVAGTFSGASFVNNLYVSGDTADAHAGSNGGLFTLGINHNVGGATVAGSRGTIWSQLNVSSLTNPSLEMTGINSTIFVNGAAGGAFCQALNTSVVLNSGATVGNTINEMMVTAKAGSTVGNKTFLQFTVGGGDVVDGSTSSGLNVTSANGAATASPGLAQIISIGTPALGWPLSATKGTVVGITPQVANQGAGRNLHFIPPQAFAGIDLQLANFTLASGYAFRSPGYSVDGAGQVSFANGLLGAAANGVTLDVPSQIVTAAVVAAGGGGGGSGTNDYYVGDILYGANGGQYRVATVTAGAVAAVTILVPGVATSPPANPVATTGGSGINCTLTLTWSGTTARSGLSLNPTGQRIGFNGTAPVAKPTVSGAKGSNAALASLMTALAAYGLVTDTTTA